MIGALGRRRSEADMVLRGVNGCAVRLGSCDLFLVWSRPVWWLPRVFLERTARDWVLAAGWLVLSVGLRCCVA